VDTGEDKCMFPEHSLLLAIHRLSSPRRSLNSMDVQPPTSSCTWDGWGETAGSRLLLLAHSQVHGLQATPTFHLTHWTEPGNKADTRPSNYPSSLTHRPPVEAVTVRLPSGSFSADVALLAVESRPVALFKWKTWRNRKWQETGGQARSQKSVSVVSLIGNQIQGLFKDFPGTIPSNSRT